MRCSGEKSHSKSDVPDQKLAEYSLRELRAHRCLGHNISAKQEVYVSMSYLLPIATFLARAQRQKNIGCSRQVREKQPVGDNRHIQNNVNATCWPYLFRSSITVARLTQPLAFSIASSPVGRPLSTPLSPSAV